MLFSKQRYLRFSIDSYLWYFVLTRNLCTTVWWNSHDAEKSFHDKRHESSIIIQATKNHRNEMNTWNQQFDRFHDQEQSILDFENIDRHQYNQHEHERMNWTINKYYWHLIDRTNDKCMNFLSFKSCFSVDTLIRKWISSSN
jgi:hypothetical protein